MAAALVLLLPLTTAPLHAQSARSSPPSGIPVDTTGLGRGPHARMHMLLEKTLFQVDVLTLEVRLGATETERIDVLIAAGRPSGEPLRDSVAAVALGAREAWARLEFKRNVSLSQFLDGVRDNLREATRAGVIEPRTFRGISDDLPVWYAFLDQRGIHAGDQMYYRIHGDSLHTVYVANSGETLLDQVDVGPERRLSVLGGYFAPGSDFRDKLVDSLLSGA